ncbi:MAG: fumarylacetoacetate hydrolase family protein [Flavobacteriales bacterium]|nr:fumarylacetoacetate hydrolase family protein [Flavobacteriales bacterium]
MKIICIGRNYSDHAKELGNAVPDEPVIFLKPESALIPTGGPIRLPIFSKEIHHEIELVYRLARVNGKAVANGVTIGLDLTARDVQEQLKKKGLPWEKAKAFDGSAYVALPFLGDEALTQRYQTFSLVKNGTVVQEGHNGQMIFDLGTLITCTEKYMRIEDGDLLFSGTPAGVGPLNAGDRLEGILLDRKRFDLSVEGPRA